MAPNTKAILVNCDPSEHEPVFDVLSRCAIDVEAEFPDARTAIDNVRLAPTEQCLCVVRVTSREQAQHLRWLSESFVGRPLLALVEADCPSGLLFAVNRAGAGQVLPLPLELDDFKAALRSIRVRHAPLQAVAARRVISVSGVTGGCGATTIAINLAYEIAEQFDLSCILVELAPMGMVATCLDVDARHTTADLLCNMEMVDVQLVEKTLSRITDRLRILPAPFREAEPLTTRPGEVARLIEYAKQLADVVVLDLPVNNYDCHFETFAAADQVVLVAEQAVPSLRALTYVREKLDQDEGFRRQTLVINRYNPAKEGFTVSHLQRLLHTPQLMTVANDYLAVSASLNEGRPLREQAPKSAVLADLNKLASLLIGSGPPEQDTAKPKLRRGFRQRVRALFGL